jgi:Uma2 family endonuclease
MNARIPFPTLDLPVHRRRLTVAEYHKMGEAGILDEDSRVELIEGELIQMPPIGTPHASTLDRLAALLIKRTEDVIVRIQNPIGLGNFSEPGPDIVLAKDRPGGYAKKHPGPKDILLIIEVCDSTLRFDREVKVPLYARHKVPEVWLLDLAERQLEIYRKPSAKGYAQILRPGTDEKISPAQLPQLKPTATLLFGA